MRGVLLFCSGILLAAPAEAILGISHDLYALEEPWFSPAFMRIVGVAAIVQGVVAALGAGLCLGRAFGRLTSAEIQSGTTVSGPAPAALGGGPVLPICGVLFLLATVGPYLIGQSESHMVELMASRPPDGNYSSEVVDYHRERARTAQTFAVHWLVVGGALLATPLFMKSSIWHMGWRINGAGCGIALGGFLLSGMGVLVVFGNAMGMEGARMEPCLVGLLGVLAGAIVAVVGTIIAAVGKTTAGNATSQDCHRRTGVKTMMPSVQRGRLTIEGLMVGVVASSTGFYVGLPVDMGEWQRAAIAVGSALPLLLLLFWMLWRGSLSAKWRAVTWFVVQGLFTGPLALLIGLEVILPVGDSSAQAVGQAFVYGLAAWTLFSIAAAMILALSPSVQEFLRIQRALSCNKPSEPA